MSDPISEEQNGLYLAYKEIINPKNYFRASLNSFAKLNTHTAFSYAMEEASRNSYQFYSTIKSDAPASGNYIRDFSKVKFTMFFNDKVKEKLKWLSTNKVLLFAEGKYVIISFNDAVQRFVSWKSRIDKYENFK